MKTFLTLLLATLCAASGYAQTIKALGYNTTNGRIVYGGTNTMTFTNNVAFNSLHAEQVASGSVYSLTIGQTNTGFKGMGAGTNDFVFARSGFNILGLYSGQIQSLVTHNFSAPLVLNYGSGQTSVISFGGSDAALAAAISRTNLGLGWSALTNTNASTSLLGFTTNGEVVANTETNTLTFTNDGVKFQSNGIVVGNVAARFSQSGGGAAIGWQGSGQRITFASGVGMRLEEAGLGIAFGTNNTNGAAITRTNLGLGLPALTNTSNLTMMRALAGSTNTNEPFSGSISVVGTNNTNTLVFTNGILLEVTAP